MSLADDFNLHAHYYHEEDRNGTLVCYKVPIRRVYHTPPRKPEPPEIISKKEAQIEQQALDDYCTKHNINLNLWLKRKRLAGLAVRTDDGILTPESVRTILFYMNQYPVCDQACYKECRHYKGIYRACQANQANRRSHE